MPRKSGNMPIFGWFCSLAESENDYHRANRKARLHAAKPIVRRAKTPAQAWLSDVVGVDEIGPELQHGLEQLDVRHGLRAVARPEEPLRALPLRELDTRMSAGRRTKRND